MANKICSRCGEQVNIMGYSDHLKKHINKEVKRIIREDIKKTKQVKTKK